MENIQGAFKPDYKEDSKFRYSVVPNDLVRDASVSPACRWLVIYLSSNSPNWEVKAKQIVNHCKGFLGRDQVYAILNEAIEAGYIQRQERMEKGLKRVSYLISTDKKFKKCLPRPENQDAERQGTERQDNKEVPSTKNYQKEESNEPFSVEKALSDFILEKIKTQKENFSGKVSPKWLKDSKKLLSMRTAEEIRKVIDWVFEDPFWSGVVMSPGGLLKNLDKIEFQMLRNLKGKDSPRSVVAENQKLAQHVAETYLGNKDIVVGYNYIEFRLGRMGMPDPHIQFTESGFAEQLQTNLYRLGLSMPQVMSQRPQHS
jgi:hypothetical protein